MFLGDDFCTLRATGVMGVSGSLGLVFPVWLLKIDQILLSLSGKHGIWNVGKVKRWSSGTEARRM